MYVCCLRVRIPAVTFFVDAERAETTLIVAIVVPVGFAVLVTTLVIVLVLTFRYASDLPELPDIPAFIGIPDIPVWEPTFVNCRDAGDDACHRPRPHVPVCVRTRPDLPDKPDFVGLS